MNVPPDKKAVLVDINAKKVYVVDGQGEPDKELSDFVNGEKRHAILKDRESRAETSGMNMKAEPRRPQSLKDLAEETFNRAECIGDMKQFMETLTAEYYRRNISRLEMHVKQLSEDGRRAGEALENLKAVQPRP